MLLVTSHIDDLHIFGTNNYRDVTIYLPGARNNSRQLDDLCKHFNLLPTASYNMSMELYVHVCELYGQPPYTHTGVSFTDTHTHSGESFTDTHTYND